MTVVRVVQRTINFCFSKDYDYCGQMFSKIRNSANKNTRFYYANLEEVHSGYLFKSPPQTQAHFKSLKSWKRRFFVLSRTPENQYELKFFKDENRREKPQGQINLYRVNRIFRLIEYHPVWLWIQKNFKCSASCVLYMLVKEREYFLIGDNSNQVEDWFNAIFQAVNTLPKYQEIQKKRSMSEPLNIYQNLDQEQKEQDPVSSSLPIRQSAPEAFNALYSHYDYPKNYMLSLNQLQQSEDSEEDEEDEMKIYKERETEENTSDYMDMKSLTEVLKQTQDQELSFSQTKLEGNNASEKSFHQTGNEGVGSTALISQIPPGSETVVPVEKEIFISQDELKNSVIFTEKGGRVCVSSWRYTQSSDLFHEDDQILTINDLLTDSLGDLQTYLRKLTKDQVKLTILRQPGSQPLSGCCT